MRIDRPTGLVNELDSLRRRVSTAERVNSVNNGGLSSGGFTVYNADGTPSVLLGLQPDGSRGVGVYDDNGNIMTLAGLAFGVRSASDTGIISWSQGGGDGSPVWTVTGPTVEVPVRTGRMIVIASGKVEAGGNKARAVYSWRVTGPTGPTSRIVEYSFDRGTSVLHDSGGLSVQTAGAFAFEHKDLLPGDYTVTSAYGFSSSPGPGGAFGSVSQRTLIVLPY